MAKASILPILVKELGLNNYQFELEIKAGNGTLRRLIDNDSDITPNLINKIRIRYPEVKESWLQTGKGPIKGMADSRKQMIMKKIEEIDHEIGNLQRKVRELKKII